MKPAFHDYADRLGRFFEVNGLPRAAGRVLSYMLTCDPPEQTFDEIVAAVGASRSTVSVATRLLITLKLIERFGLPKQRRDRYRIRDDAWTMLLQQDRDAATALKALADEGLRLLEGKPSASRARLRAMKEFYVFLEAAYTPIFAQWEQRRPHRSGRSR